MTGQQIEQGMLLATLLLQSKVDTCAHAVHGPHPTLQGSAASNTAQVRLVAPAAHMLAEELLHASVVEQQQQLWAQASLADSLEGADLSLPVKEVAGAGVHAHQHNLGGESGKTVTSATSWHCVSSRQAVVATPIGVCLGLCCMDTSVRRHVCPMTGLPVPPVALQLLPFNLPVPPVRPARGRIGTPCWSWHPKTAPL